jgi:hypothetical protein
VLVWVAVMQWLTSVPRPMATLLHRESTLLTDMLGHGLGFALLSWLVIRWLKVALGGGLGRKLAWAAALCLLYAVLDELHQIPIPGRSPEWLDLGLDAMGTVVGLGLAVVAGRR